MNPLAAKTTWRSPGIIIASVFAVGCLAAAAATLASCRYIRLEGEDGPWRVVFVSAGDGRKKVRSISIEDGIGRRPAPRSEFLLRVIPPEGVEVSALKSAALVDCLGREEYVFHRDLSDPAPEGRRTRWIVAAALILIVAFPLFIIVRGACSPPAKKAGPWRFAVALMAAGLLASSFAVALKSGLDAHPDEMDHVLCGRYYLEDGNWLPPDFSVFEPALETRGLAVSGWTYLLDGNAVYLFAGKAAALLSWLGAKDHVLLRCFNVACLAGAVLTLLLLYRGRTQPLLLFFLFPQAWYLAGYFNGEAAPFAVALALAGVTAHPVIRRRLRNAGRSSWPRLACIAAGLAFLAVSKLNYLLAAGILAGSAAWAVTRGLRRFDRPRLCRLALLAAVPLFFWSCREISYQAANGFHASAKILEFQELRASPGIKPSQRHDSAWLAVVPHVFMRDRGVPLKEVLGSHWVRTSLRSLQGVYGWMDVKAPQWYYVCMTLLSVFAALGTALSAVRILDTRSLAAGTALLVLILCLAVGQSVWFSWTVAYQPQGRYLLPGAVLVMWLLLLRCRVLAAAPRWPFIAAGGLGLWSLLHLAAGIQ